MYWITYNPTFGVISCETSKQAAGTNEVFIWPRRVPCSSVIEGFTAPDPRPGATWDDVRAIRDYLLADSDWVGLVDCPLFESEKQDWYNYRQALRDITVSYPTPQEVKWPEKP